MYFWIITIVVLFALEVTYLKLADRLNIIDKPNLRSSHSIPVVRGGALIFPLAWLIMSAYSNWKFPWFSAGLVILSLVSFWDDMRPLTAGQRFIFHIISCVLMFTELSLWNHVPVWALVMLFIAVIGILNAFNFMDGINGITGMYALSFLIPITLFIPNANDLMSLDPLRSPVIITGLSILVFGFFNFRKKARCFAGDVGSISIGYILVFMLFSLMTDQESILGINHQGSIQEFDIYYILMFAVYGVDTILTILQRLKMGQNIFEAHRMHLYQYMANELKIPHLYVSLIYALCQLMLNLYVLSGSVTWWGATLILTSLAMVYLSIKAYVQRRINIAQ